MSINSESHNVDNSLMKKKDKGGKDNVLIMEMMKDMQRNVMSLTKAVSDLQENRRTKRKLRELNDNPGTSKSNAEFSDISDEEKDELDDVLNEVNRDIDTDCDNLLDELAECFGTEDNYGEAIHEKLAKVTNDSVRAVVDSEKIKEVSEKYYRPMNVQNLVTPKLNEDIRAQPGAKIYGFKKTQTLVGKAIISQLQQNSLLPKVKQKGDTPSMKKSQACRWTA